MKESLSYIRVDLQAQISALCTHLRRKAYPQGSPQHENALVSMIYDQLLEDELGRLLAAEDAIITAMEKHQAGEAFDPFGSVEPKTIYAFCLAYFESEDCPLGSSSDELQKWVATYADRQQKIRKDFDLFYPNTNFLVIEKDTEGNEGIRPVTDAELFNSKARGFLRDIENSNVLIEFNERMLQVKQMLVAQDPVVYILSVLKRENSHE